ncbi:MAG: histidine phosphatase family protein [Gammaproteobacteria bacterium]|nr:histidine phosphatase family protein [Gammaproteobacteria bacterium]
MKKSLSYLLRAIAPFFLWMPIALAQPVFSEIIPTADLIKALQSGGHVIYMRHGETDHTQKDINRDNLEDCNGQRNLSARGREKTERIGRSIRALKIPVADVSSSPYCRCKDTARLTFGKFHVEKDLYFSISKDEAESARLGKRLYAMMMASDTSSGNIVFVGHTANLKDGLGIWPKPEGALAVFQKEESELIFRGMIRPDEWPEHYYCSDRRLK